ncbi:ATP-binding protein [Aurantimonas sp. Leaf443]|uniref:sensor histidine kinase n=1 Tax=Aurantimonas sp. Leaf443 TaxID=1736378 RepID=UPI0007019819|nr:ATP-binding protein [Aurantimonas sp. Leaf443]KQT82150.1 ATPase [Aurantimonas sp. Leaf443]
MIEPAPRTAATATATATAAGRSRRGGRVRFRPAMLLAPCLGAGSLLCVAAAGWFAAEEARLDLLERARSGLTLSSAALSGQIEKQRLLPLALSRDAELAGLLRTPDRGLAARLDARLEALAAEAQASVLYVVGADGITVASSNAGTPQSFVGASYRFRRYFAEAMAKGRALQYALGTVSRRPGLYLSQRVDAPAGPLGTVVVKVEFDDLEARWREAGFLAFVSDASGTVLATSVPAWRFGVLSPVDAEQAADIRDDLQNPDAPLRPLPLAAEPGGLWRVGAGKAVPAGLYVEAAGAIPGAPGDWRLHVFLPAGPALARAAANARLIAGLVLVAAGLLAALVVRRRRALRQRQETLSAMNAELETRVAERTRALRHANEALTGEIAGRRGAEARVQNLRDELAQANRLSLLGQIAAGVAHEINQPLAAIRTYAENAGRFLGLGRAEPAAENLASIVALTGRVAAITDTLKSFSRRATGPVEPVRLGEALDGALSLLAGRIDGSGIAIERADPGDLRVSASRIRLEQILVNLLQNALDALAGRPDPRIVVTVEARAETVVVTVADNGPGLSPEIERTLFMPFVTTKEKGLGLGLVICGEIAREFGGSLALAPGRGPGAAFALTLRRAP